ncbi:MAG: putative aminohydrolase SsnA [Cetobacterium sp.]
MLLVGNGILITHNTENELVNDGCIAIEDNLIKKIGKTKELREEFKECQFIDAKGKIIMPGLINTHHHIYSAFARGLNMGGAESKSFREILENIWWKIDKKITLEDVKYSAYSTFVESIKNGVTTIFDHHASPMAIEGSLFTLSEVAEEIGIRGVFCYEVSDRDGKEILEAGIKENVDFIKYANEREDDMIKGLFGMHASFTLTNESLVKCTKAMKGLDAGYHIHVSEGIEDLLNSLKVSNKRTIQRLNDYGILGEKTLAIHCIHINGEEIELLKETNTSVINNPESNMSNAVGTSPVLKMIKEGIRVGLGTDGYSSDMLQSMKVENIILKHNNCNSNVGFLETGKMLFENNREIANKYFNNGLGIIKEGAYADIIIVDYKPYTEINVKNFLGHILFGISGSDVETVIINGKIVMKERNIITVDEENLFENAKEVSKKLWRRLGL